MALHDRVYRRTRAGDEAVESEDSAIPSDYRRILRLVEGDTHSDVICGRLRHFSDSMLADWLVELEEIGFLSSAAGDSSQSPDFAALMTTAANTAAAGTEPEDSQRADLQAEAAATALEAEGAYLALDRLRQRDPLEKKAEETTVLIVEDDPDQLALADLRVSMAGYRVRVARDLHALRADFQSQPLPDLVLLDVQLPDRSGFEILEAMRRHPRLAMLPVIMLTAMVGAEDVSRGLALGADGYITKPYSKTVITETIRQVLKQG